MICRVDQIPGALSAKYASLVETIGSYPAVVVAVSGGVDSAFLLAAAVAAHGERVRAVLGYSPSVPGAILDRARRVAERLGLALEVRESREMERPAYLANAPDRCFHCKDELYELLGALAAEGGGAVVLDGTNLDDLSDHRPGLEAVRARGVVCPLADQGWTKEEIREASRLLGLETWDQPSSPCLSSRIPHGTPVTAPALRSIEAAERGLHAMGFPEVRVRHHGPLARIELPADRIRDAAVLRESIVEAVRAAGYRWVTLDLAGYRTRIAKQGAADDGSTYTH